MKPRGELDMVEEDPAGAVMTLRYVVATLETWAKGVPFISSATGLTVNPQPITSELYREIARKHAQLGEIPEILADEHAFTLDRAGQK